MSGPWTCILSRGNLLASLAFAALSAGAAVAQTDLSFFITSQGPGRGADLGGLEGADAHCQTLAVAAGAGERTWRAYLSTQATGGQAAVNARDRIGPGPWHNALNVLIASDVDELHSENNNLNKETALDEKGAPIKGRGDSPNQHDILTGSQLDGTAFPGADDLTCQNWTSSAAGAAQVGHHDRQGGGANPTSWNSAHASRGCSQSNLQSTGGNGYFYCFAADSPDAATAVRAEAAGQPPGAALYQNAPNPFNSQTLIRYALAAPQEIRLDIYNLEGQKVATLASGTRAAGTYEVRWDGRDDEGRPLASGAYLYRLRAADRIETRKLLLLR